MGGRAARDRTPAPEEGSMASEHVHEFTDTNFDAEVIKSEHPTLVDFWAVWCGPCRAIAPIVEALAKQYAGKVKIGKLDVDNNQKVAQQYGIQSIPTLLLFKGGKVVEQLVGAGPQVKAKLEAAFQKAM
jgi:thioredoxin 1